MEPLVSIIMGSTSDLPVMEKASQILNEFKIPFEINALSAHRTPEEVERFAKGAASRGIRVIIAAAGMAAGKVFQSLGDEASVFPGVDGINCVAGARNDQAGSQGVVKGL